MLPSTHVSAEMKQVIHQMEICPHKISLPHLFVIVWDNPRPQFNHTLYNRGMKLNISFLIFSPNALIMQTIYN